MMRRVLVAGVVGCCAGLLWVVPAFAGVGAVWSVSGVSRPTNFRPGGDAAGDAFVVLVTNTGGAVSSGAVTVTDELPAGVEAAPGITAENVLLNSEHPGSGGFSGGCEVDGEEEAGRTKVSCTYLGAVPVDDTLVLRFPVRVAAHPPESCTEPLVAPAVSCVENVVRAAGGGGLPGSVATPVVVSGSAAGFGVSPGGSSASLSSVQAGTHPDLTVSTAFNTENTTGATVGNLKNTTFDLPPGFAGDLVDTPACAAVDFLREECPVATQVGVTTIDILPYGPQLQPVYSLAPEPGEVGKLGFWVKSFFYEGDIKVREPGEPGPTGGPGEPYGLKTTFYNATASTVEVDNVALSVWGVPASPIHDPLRYNPGELVKGSRNGRHFGVSSTSKEAPFFTNPTACGTGPLEAVFKVTSWQNPGEAENPGATRMLFGPMVGCDALMMEPSLTGEISTNKASSATGLDVATIIPQTYANAHGVATPALEREVVTLPEGMTVNPSSGAGLQACSEAQYAEEGPEPVPGHGCPVASKLATVRIKTPSIEEEVTGSVFLAEPAPRGPLVEPGRNPFGSLLALYLIARAPNRGVLVKAPGETTANPVTGQLTTTFGAVPAFDGLPASEGLPPLPFSIATFAFNQGTNAPLVTPPLCGDYEVSGALTPYSNPTQTLTAFAPPFQITNSYNGSECPTTGTPPFTPRVVAGTEDNDAGGYSAFDLSISRGDGEQEVTGFSSVLPSGLSADLDGVAMCSEAEVAAARSETGGEAEVGSVCPVGSEIGYTVAEAGVGSVLAQTPGRLFLGEGFDGAPFSLVSITSAKVGPFDLGTVVVHLPLDIDPRTAVVSIPEGAADQIPHILKGIVVHLRNIRVYVNREHFMLNPTSCDPLVFSATVVGGGADPANPADNDPVAETDPFQAADCSNLAFSPSFSVSTAGQASKQNGASLVFKVAYPKNALGSESWFNEAKFDIPKQLPARLTTIQKACLAATFETNRAACPAASIIGHARVHTQILPVPLEGPVYFVSYGAAKFPDAVMVLKGYGVTIELHGETFINHKTGVTSATFRSLPDVPFESIEVSVPTGPFSEFGANLPAKDRYSFCGQKLTMPTLFKASNGAEIHRSTPVTITGCKKHIKHPVKHKKKKKK